MEARITPEEGAPACSPTVASAPSLQVDHVPQPDALLEEDHSETLQCETIDPVSNQTEELAAVQQQMTELQSQKTAALQIEDYDLAKQCKVQIEAAAARAEALEQQINQVQGPGSRCPILTQFCHSLTHPKFCTVSITLSHSVSGSIIKRCSSTREPVAGVVQGSGNEGVIACAAAGGLSTRAESQDCRVAGLSNESSTKSL